MMTVSELYSSVFIVIIINSPIFKLNHEETYNIDISVFIIVIIIKSPIFIVDQKATYNIMFILITISFQLLVSVDTDYGDFSK